MLELFLLSRRQMRRIEPFFPKPRGLPRVDDRRVISGIIYVIHNGLQWQDAPAGYGPYKTPGPRCSAWTRYILSLIFRMPTAVGNLKNHIAEMWKEGIKTLEADYENRRLPTDPPTFAEYFALTNPAAPQIGAANLLMQIIDNDRVGPTVFNMHWFRIPLPKANVELLCSDRPIDRPLGFDDPRAYIALPVAPRLLFLAAQNEELPNAISGWSHTEIVKQMNRTVVTQAREFVWGSNDSQLGFISKHLGSASERDLLTPEQRAEVIAAATGQRRTACGIN